MNRFSIYVKTLLVLFVFIGFQACKKDEKQPIPDLGYDFYPIDSGWVRVYAVDSIAYDDNDQSIDTFHFILSEHMLGTISGQGLEKHTEVARLVQADSLGIWQNRSSFFVLKTNQNLQRLEENIRTVKFTFPAGDILSWNGNMYNALGRKTYLLQNLHQSFNSGDTLYQDCMTVQEALANNAIEEILIKSVYCKGIGLIDFTNNYVNTQSTGKLGYKVHLRLIKYTRP